MKTVKKVITRGIFVMVLTFMAMTSTVMMGNKTMTGTKVAEAKGKIKIPKNAKKEEKKAAKKINKSSADIWSYKWKKGRLIQLKGQRIKEAHLKELTGLEDFYMADSKTKEKWDFSALKKLKSLYFCSKYLTKIDLSKNKKLADLQIIGAQIKNLDLSKNTNLKYLNLQRIPVSRLDLSKNTKLEKIRLDELPINKLDLSKAVKLQDLMISGIDTMTAFSCKGLSSLKFLNITYCEKMQTIHVANCSQLIRISAQGNQLEKVIIENCPSLPPHEPYPTKNPDGSSTYSYADPGINVHNVGREYPVLLYDNKLYYYRLSADGSGWMLQE